jgi:hypothetical protein
MAAGVRKSLAGNRQQHQELAKRLPPHRSHSRAGERLKRIGSRGAIPRLPMRFSSPEEEWPHTESAE